MQKSSTEKDLQIVKHLNLHSACRLLNRKIVSIRTLSQKNRYHVNLLLLGLDLQKTSPPKTSISLSLHTAQPTPDPKPSVRSMVPPPPPYMPAPPAPLSKSSTFQNPHHRAFLEFQTASPVPWCPSGLAQICHYSAVVPEVSGNLACCLPGWGS